MSAVLSLARHTVLDAMRERAFLVLGGFAVMLFLASRLLSPLALGEAERVTIDLGVGALGAVGFLLLVLLGTRMLHREIDRKTILMLLAKPIRREEFIFGKFLGLAGVLGLSLGGMLLLLAAVMAASGYSLSPALLAAGYFAWLELVVMAAVTMLLTCLTSPVLATFFLVSLFIIGHLAGSLLELAGLLPGSLVSLALEGLFLILPRLDLFSYTLEVFHRVHVPSEQLLWATLYAGVYSAAVLAIGSVIFRRREFS